MNENNVGDCLKIQKHTLWPLLKSFQKPVGIDTGGFKRLFCFRKILELLMIIAWYFAQWILLVVKRSPDLKDPEVAVAVTLLNLFQPREGGLEELNTCQRWWRYFIPSRHRIWVSRCSYAVLVRGKETALLNFYLDNPCTIINCGLI